METENTPDFGTVLKRYRVANGLTQEQLAERAGLSVRGISDLERGARVQPRAYTVHQLADALGLAAADRAQFEAAARAEAHAGSSRSVALNGTFLPSIADGELVARAEECEHLRSALSSTEEGAGRLVLLGGEPGIGKTRLVRDVLEEAQARGHVVLATRWAEPGQQAPIAPFLEALAALAAAPPDGLRTEVQRGWKRIARIAENLPPNADGTGPGVVAQQELFRAILELLILAARSAPIVLVLDDLQCADEQSLRLLVHLARAVPTAAILLVGAFRDTRISDDHPVLAQTLKSLARDRLADRLTIRRLSHEETARLAEVLMGGQPLSEEFAHFVYRRTKGIPRLIEQLVRSLGGRLELQGEIGAGNMGRVFRAHDRERGEEVAAKIVLARSEIDLDTLLRFQQEGAVLARLDHPHIVRIHGTFAEEHASCIIMELLGGQSLRQILLEGPLSLLRARQLALQVADAIAYAHGQEIVHRDIKPDASLRTIATTGMRMGTPLYMAPEQIEGKQVDGRSDVYALGAMLYHMVSGSPPFPDSDALTVAIRHLREEPRPPSWLVPSVPAEWDALILKAMAKEPANRFQRMRYERRWMHCPRSRGRDLPPADGSSEDLPPCRPRVPRRGGPCRRGCAVSWAWQERQPSVRRSFPGCCWPRPGSRSEPTLRTAALSPCGG